MLVAPFFVRAVCVSKLPFTRVPGVVCVCVCVCWRWDVTEDDDGGKSCVKKGFVFKRRIETRASRL